jgi:histone-lysine N-methyltransferase SETD3
MMRWLEESGARIAGATIERDRDGRRGLCARAETPAGAALVEVPLRCIITTEVAQASDVGQRIAASGIEPPSSQSVIAAFLLQEKGRGRSFFAPYLDALPASYPDMPSSFGKAELSLLRGSFTLAKIAQRRASLAREHQALCYHVRELRAFSLAEYVWARTAIMSRIFGIVVEGKKTEGLVPMADMCNHSTVRETSWAYHDDAGAFRTTALQPFRPGDPIFEHYGRKCNSRFFVNYGFALDDNEDNEAVVVLEIPAGDPLRDAKARILGDAKRAFQVPARLDHDETRRMLSFLQVACADPDELALLSRAQLSGARIVPALSPANEAAALALLSAACSAALDRFDTTVEEDDALLQDPRLGRRARSCVVMRRGEKQVLHRLLDMAEEALPLLRLPP